MLAAAWSPMSMLSHCEKLRAPFAVGATETKPRYALRELPAEIPCAQNHLTSSLKLTTKVTCAYLTAQTVPAS